MAGCPFERCSSGWITLAQPARFPPADNESANFRASSVNARRLEANQKLAGVRHGVDPDAHGKAPADPGAAVVRDRRRIQPGPGCAFGGSCSGTWLDPLLYGWRFRPFPCDPLAKPAAPVAQKPERPACLPELQCDHRKSGVFPDYPRTGSDPQVHLPISQPLQAAFPLCLHKVCAAAGGWQPDQTASIVEGGLGAML
jgi:hypothetical protein